jgi:hypothetical protein
MATDAIERFVHGRLSGLVGCRVQGVAFDGGGVKGG